MSLPRIATRDEWLAARKELLAKEKRLTTERDALNTERRNLPMVEIEKDYVFAGPDGEARLLDMFDGRNQLIIYHFMFDPDWDEGCPSCTAGTDEMSQGLLDHLYTCDTSYAMVSRAPLEKLERWKQKRGLGQHPLVLVLRHRLQLRLRRHDRRVGAARRVQLPHQAEFEALGDNFFDFDQPFEMPGRSCFLQVDGTVYHTYSQYARGLESTGGSYYFLDLTGARPPGGLGGAQGPQRVRAQEHPRLRQLTLSRR